MPNEAELGEFQMTIDRRTYCVGLMWCSLLIALLSGCALRSAETPPAISTLESTPTSLPTSTAEITAHADTITPTQIPSPTATIDPFPEVEAIDKTNTYWLDTVASFGEGHIFDVTLSPDQSLFAVYTETGIYLYDRATFAEVNYVSPDSPFILDDGHLEDVIRFMPNGRQLLFSRGSRLKIWDFTTNESPEWFRTDVYMSGWQTTQIEFTFDGNYMIQTTKGDGTSGAWITPPLDCPGDDGIGVNVAIFDLTTLTKTYDRHECGYSSVPRYRITEDGFIQFFTGSWMTPYYPQYPLRTVVINLKTGEEMASAKQNIFGSNTFDLSEVETSGDVSLLPTEDEFILWEDEQLRVIPQLVVDPPCGIQQYVGGGYRVFYADEQTFILIHNSSSRYTYKIEQWNKITCTIENSLSYQTAQSVQFSPTGSMFIINNGTSLEVWDLKTQALLFTIEAKGVSTPIGLVHFSEDESKLFVGSPSYMSSLSLENVPQPIEIWDIATGMKIDELQPTKYHFSGVALTHKPEIILVFDEEEETILWNIETNTPLTSIETPFPRAYAVDPARDGVWFARNNEDSYSYDLFLVDVNTGEIKQEMAPRNGDIYRIDTTLTERGLYLFERRGIVNVIDVDSEQLLWQENGHHSAFYQTTDQGELYDADYGEWIQLFSPEAGVASPKFIGDFAADSRTLLITELDGEYFIWEKESGGYVDKIATHSGIVDIAISPDSHFIVAVTSNGQIEIMGIGRDK